ncbi:7114_t:CDS:2, partial [Acaulospora colombiana]
NRKHGQKGFITVRMVFTPQIIAKSRKSTSTFSTAGRAVNQVGNAPIAVGKGVIGGVGTAGKGVAGGVGAVGKGVKGLFGGGRKGSDADATILPATGLNSAGIPVIQEPPSTQVTEQIPGAPAPAAGYTLGNDSQTFPKTPTSGNPMEGVLRVTVQNGKDLADSDGDQVRPYVVLSMGGKKQETKHVSKTNNADWEEAFTFQVGPETKTLHLEVMDNRTFGKDKSIGQTDIAIWDKLQPSGSNPVSSAI